MGTSNKILGVALALIFCLAAMPALSIVKRPIPVPVISLVAVHPTSATFNIFNTGSGRWYAFLIKTNLMSGPWVYAGGFTNNTANPNITVTVSTNLFNFSAPHTFVRLLDITGGFFQSGIFIGNGALIQAASFTMGDTLDGETDAVPTNINMPGFYMQTNLVTYGQWQRIYNWAITNGFSFDNSGSGKGTNYPVETINWFDAVKWCNACSLEQGFNPVYYTDAALTQVYTNGDVVPFVNWGPMTNSVGWVMAGYRLPTEAEWEEAAKGGLSGDRFPWGNTISDSQANYDGNTEAYAYDLGPDGFNTNFDTLPGPYTSPAGYFPSNGYCLCDMAGNVQEWCWDWYGTPYGQPTTTDPTGPATGTYRVLRGGGWADDASHARCASRAYSLPTTANNDIGFRIGEY